MKMSLPRGSPGAGKYMRNPDVRRPLKYRTVEDACSWNANRDVRASQPSRYKAVEPPCCSENRAGYQPSGPTVPGNKWNGSESARGRPPSSYMIESNCSCNLGNGQPLRYSQMEKDCKADDDNPFMAVYCLKYVQGAPLSEQTKNDCTCCLRPSPTSGKGMKTPMKFGKLVQTSDISQADKTTQFPDEKKPYKDKEIELEEYDVTSATGEREVTVRKLESFTRFNPGDKTKGIKRTETVTKYDKTGNEIRKDEFIAYENSVDSLDTHVTRKTSETRFNETGKEIRKRNRDETITSTNSLGSDRSEILRNIDAKKKSGSSTEDELEESVLELSTNEEEPIKSTVEPTADNDQTSREASGSSPLDIVSDRQKNEDRPKIKRRFHKETEHQTQDGDTGKIESVYNVVSESESETKVVEPPQPEPQPEAEEKPRCSCQNVRRKCYNCCKRVQCWSPCSCRCPYNYHQRPCTWMCMSYSDRTNWNARCCCRNCCHSQNR